MNKIKKDILTPKWLKVKKMFEEGTNGSKQYGTNFEIGGELDVLSREIIDLVGELTHIHGYDSVIEGVHMNTWKERIWILTENAGLLEDIAWKTDLEEEEKEDRWGEDEREFYINEDEVDEYIKSITK